MYCTEPLSPRKGRLRSFHDDDGDDDDDWPANTDLYIANWVNRFFQGSDTINYWQVHISDDKLICEMPQYMHNCTTTRIRSTGSEKKLLYVCRYAYTGDAAAGHAADAWQHSHAVFLRFLHIWHHWRPDVEGTSATALLRAGHQRLNW